MRYHYREQQLESPPDLLILGVHWVFDSVFLLRGY